MLPSDENICNKQYALPHLQILTLPAPHNHMYYMLLLIELTIVHHDTVLLQEKVDVSVLASVPLPPSSAPGHTHRCPYSHAAHETKTRNEIPNLRPGGGGGGGLISITNYWRNADLWLT